MHFYKMFLETKSQNRYWGVVYGLHKGIRPQIPILESKQMPKLRRAAQRYRILIY